MMHDITNCITYFFTNEIAGVGMCSHMLSGGARLSDYITNCITNYITN